MSDLSVVQHFSVPDDLGGLRLSVVDDVLGKVDDEKTIRLQSALVDAVRAKGAQCAVPMDFSETVRFVMGVWAFGPEHFKSVLEQQMAGATLSAPVRAPQAQSASAPQ